MSKVTARVIVRTPGSGHASMPKDVRTADLAGLNQHA